MVTPTGNLKLLDLGIARLLVSQGDSRELTGTGHFVGTPAFMAPEQVSDPKAVDIRADIYSLGCTLYYLLSGTVPFSREEYPNPIDLMTAHTRVPVPPIQNHRPEIPDELAKTIELLLAKSADDRPDTPADVARMLEPFAQPG